jgi:hypothetical protein
VEVASRIARVWDDDDVLDPDAVDIAETVLKVGIGRGGGGACMLPQPGWLRDLHFISPGSLWCQCICPALF